MTARRPTRRTRLGTRLGTRLLLGVALALGAGAVAAWLIALLVGPAIFHEHMLMVETHHPDPEVVAHAEDAFDHTWQLSLSLALFVAGMTSILVSAFLARSITSTLTRVRHAASRVADGDYGVQVPEAGMGAELADMASAFNRMSDELAETELTRRRLLSDLSHEMRTPVATVDAYLEGMADGVVEADAATVTMLREQTERLRRLAEDISLVSSAEEHRLSIQPEQVSLTELMDGAAAQARASFAAAGVALETEDSSAGAQVTGDRDRLSQALTNLLDNALRHTAEGDRVILRAAGAQEVAVLEVEDTGDGVDQQHIPHLFERFYRVDAARDRAHGGSGIGLAIVRSIVEAHQGSVRVTSPGPGQGASFVIELPLSRPR